MSLMIETAERRALLATQHRLVGSRRTDDPAEIADSLVGLHSSDPASPFLSAAARMNQPSVSAVAAALYEERRLVRHHAMRRTLWVMTPETARLAHASTTVHLGGPQERRLAKLIEENGFATDGALWIDAAKQALYEAICDAHTTTTRDLSEAFPDLVLTLRTGKVTTSALPRVLLLLGLDGLIVRVKPTGTWISSQYQWTPSFEWITDGFGRADQHTAEVDLIRRYLLAFGPVTFADMQWWTGWTKTTTLRALDGAQAVEVDLLGGVGWIDRDAERWNGGSAPFVALLPGLDPTTMGWKERDWYLDPEDAGLLFDRNGNAGPTVWVDGRIVGGWVQHPSGRIVFRLTDEAAGDRIPEIEAAADGLEDVYGDVRHKVRFPAPIQHQLLAD
ncbi:MAG: winged helix DNA-binding domain-containing protein [Acidimicrobiia bacterium]